MRGMLTWLAAALGANLAVQHLVRLFDPAGGRFEWPAWAGFLGTLLGDPSGLWLGIATLASALQAWLLLRLLRAPAPLPALLGPFVVLAVLVLVVLSLHEILAVAWPSGLLGMVQAMGRARTSLPPVLVVALVLAVPVLLIRAIHRRTGVATWRVAIAVLTPNLVLVSSLVTGLPQPNEIFHIGSASMAPTLDDGDLARVNNWVGAWRGPRRGEILVTRTSDGTAWVRRVVALPGETVQLVGGVVFIDGLALARTEAGTARDDSRGVSTVRLFREQGPEGASWTVAEQTGTGWLDNTPLVFVPPGHLFMLGDNRDNSMDSRVAQVGMIPITEVQGPVFHRVTARRDAPSLRDAAGKETPR